MEDITCSDLQVLKCHLVCDSPMLKFYVEPNKGASFRGITSPLPRSVFETTFFVMSGNLVRGYRSMTPQTESVESPTILKPNDLWTVLWAPSQPYNMIRELEIIQKWRELIITKTYFA